MDRGGRGREGEEGELGEPGSGRAGGAGGQGGRGGEGGTSQLLTLNLRIAYIILIILGALSFAVIGCETRQNTDAIEKRQKENRAAVTHLCETSASFSLVLLNAANQIKRGLENETIAPENRESATEAMELYQRESMRLQRPGNPCDRIETNR